MATTSAHNAPGGAVVEHNRRDPEYVESQLDHIDPELSYRNKFFIDRDPETAINEIFADDIEKYNEGKKPSRQIKNYYNKLETARARDLKKCADEPTYIVKSKNGKKQTRKRRPKKPAPTQEMIVGVYNTDITWEVKQQICEEFVVYWQRNFKELPLIGAYFHGDEPKAQEHMHMDYTSRMPSNKQGPAHVVSYDRAYRQILQRFGIDYEAIKKTATDRHLKVFYTPQNLFEHYVAEEVFGQICQAHGVGEIEHPQRGKGVKHLDTINFKLQTEINKKQATLDQQESEITENNEVLDDLKVQESSLLDESKNLYQNVMDMSSTQENYQSQINVMSEQLKNLKNKPTPKQNVFQNLQSKRKLKELEQTLIDTKQRYKNLQTNYQTCESELKELEQQLANA